MGDDAVLLRIYTNRLAQLTPYKGDLTSLLKPLRAWLQLNSLWRSPVATLRSLENPNFVQRWKLRSIIKDSFKDDELFQLYGEQTLRALSWFIKSLSDEEIKQLTNLIMKRI